MNAPRQAPRFLRWLAWLPLVIASTMFLATLLVQVTVCAPAAGDIAQSWGWFAPSAATLIFAPLRRRIQDAIDMRSIASPASDPSLYSGQEVRRPTGAGAVRQTFAERHRPRRAGIDLSGVSSGRKSD